MKKLLWLASPFVLALGVMAGGMPGMAASAAPPPAPPGQGDCSHGNTGKACRPDPSTNGQDCDTHGKNGIGGVNEDHCLATTPGTTTDETTTDETITTDETTTTDETNNQTTSAATTTDRTETTGITTTETGHSQTTTTATGGITHRGQSRGTTPASAPAVTKTRVEGARGKQAVKAGMSRVSPERAVSGQLPFTGFPTWILVLAGSAMLVAGFGLRRLVA